MESQIKSSFIPDNMPNKQSVSSASQYSSGTTDIFMLVAVVLLAAALALAAGVFLYDQFLSGSVQKKGEQLNRAQSAFEPALIQELLRLDGRLNAADDVLAQHLAPSELFSLLEQLTLESVSFESLDYSVREDGSITVFLEGQAKSVNGVALQASVFGQHNAMVNPIFSNLDIVSEGVTFDVTAEINPSALRYTTVAGKYVQGNFGDSFSNDNALGDFGAPEEFGAFGGGDGQLPAETITP